MKKNLFIILLFAIAATQSVFVLAMKNKMENNKSHPYKKSTPKKSSKYQSKRYGESKHEKAKVTESDYEAKKIVFTDRPESVQKVVDKAFEINKSRTGEWRENGDYPYYLFGIDDNKLLEYIFSKNAKEEININIIDVGCAMGGWGTNAFKKAVCYFKAKSPKIYIHIYSITGSSECKEETIEEGNVFLHQMNNFKIENIAEEFYKRGIKLDGKVDLIVSRWTLRHLVDPFGTVAQLYSFLKINGGILISNGFFFALAGSDKIEEFPSANCNSENWRILDSSNAQTLFWLNNSSRNTGDFLLQRNNDKALGIPLKYEGTTDLPNYGFGWSCESGIVTRFELGNVNTGEKFYFKRVDDENQEEDGAKDKKRSGYMYRYCNSNSEKNKNLYKKLKDLDLFLY